MFRLERCVEAKTIGGIVKYFNSLNNAIAYATKLAENPRVQYDDLSNVLNWTWNRGKLIAMDEVNYAFYEIQEILTED